MKWISIICGLALLLMGAFASGMWTTHKNWLAWQKVSELRVFWRSWRDTGMFLPSDSYNRRPGYVPAARYTTYDTDRISDGYLFLTRIVHPAQSVVAELIDRNGDVVHAWPINALDIFPTAVENSNMHDALALPDGSVVLNFDNFDGLVRLDQCARPVWTLTDGRYHHAIHQDGPDAFWTLFSPNTPESADQNLVKIAISDGTILEKISLRDQVMASLPDIAAALGIPQGYVFADETKNARNIPDLFHINDVEPLSTEMADAFPMFAADDLMVSLRNLNLVAVLDRQTLQPKWLQYGPWRDQHDPDFEPDGTISVFSNNRGRQWSTIIAVDPETRAAKDLYNGTELRFDSYIMGKQERLANGNRLIVSTMQGRVMEVSETGEILRQYVNLLTPDYTTIVTDADILPPDFYADLPNCP